MIKLSRRIAIVAIFLTVIFTFILFSSSVYVKNFYPFYRQLDTLPSILDFPPVPGKSIFFHETSHKSEESGKIVITSRQACAVESAARLNPNFEVNLIYLSAGTIKNEGTDSDRLLQVLQYYKNVKFRHVKVEDYLQDTPVETLWKSGKIQRSDYVVSHTSDVLRYLTLWKYGGIYLDLDVIVIKSLENLPPNYAGAQSDHDVAAGVLSFEPTGVGHVLAQSCLTDLKEHFNGKLWASNGPGIITNLAKSQCASATVKALIGKTCTGNFRVYPPVTFYPVTWENWSMYFNASLTDKIRTVTEESYAIHTWNKLSYQTKIRCGDKVPYGVLAEEFCPRVYSQCKDFF